jgi:hypothetical protein
MIIQRFLSLAHAASAIVIGATLVLATFAASVRPLLAAGPDYFQYQIDFPVPFPTNGPQAFTSLDVRAIRALTAIACGAELEFWEQELEPNKRMNAIIAKMDWWGGHRQSLESPRTTGSVCRFTETRHKPAGILDGEWASLGASQVGGVNARLALEFGPACGETVSEDGTPIKGIIDAARWGPLGTLILDYTVTLDCLAAQVDAAVSKLTVVGSMGTDKLKCMQLGPERQGDWDMSLIELIRMTYLEDRYGPDLLTFPVREYLRNKLLTADGPPADESYSLLGCGNTEESTGTAEERADERSSLEETLDDLGEFYSFWFFLLFLIIAIAMLLFVIGGGAVSFLAAAAAAAAAGGAALIAFVAQINIPETENHLLMINSSKYLTNQLIIGDLGAGTDAAEPYEEDQEDLKELFLEKAQDVLSEEFIEYNSRPYARLSLAAFYNLFDFAHDPEVRLAAQMVLDYSFAKFAIGSHEGRRFVPFRRQRKVVRRLIDEPIEVNAHTSIFDLAEGADHLIALGLLYAGQIQQLAGGGFPGARISRGAAGDMVRPATSGYKPEEFVIDLAVRKHEVFQRLKYDGAEIYSSGPGFLISGGGITSGLAYSGSGIDAVDIAWKRSLKDDLGTALPTTIFLSGTPNRTTLDGVIRIEGERIDEQEDDVKFRTYDHNLCVWKGFACGLNITLPPAFASCLRQHPQAAPEWRFIDTGACPAFTGVGSPGIPRLFIVVYRQACPSGVDGCRTNSGFVEVFPAGSETLFQFATRIVAANPAGFMDGTEGKYQSARNEKIAFQTDAHQDDSDDWGIVSIDGNDQDDLDDWNFAVGNVINGEGDGRVTIRNPVMNRTLDLDMRDEDKPERTIY